jgi:hypothetical protein
MLIVYAIRTTGDEKCFFPQLRCNSTVQLDGATRRDADRRVAEATVLIYHDTEI